MYYLKDFAITLYAKQLLVMRTACITNFIRSALNGIHYLIAVHASEISNYYITFQSLTTKSHLCKNMSSVSSDNTKTASVWNQLLLHAGFSPVQLGKTHMTENLHNSTKWMKFFPLTSNRIALDIHCIGILYWRRKR